MLVYMCACRLRLCVRSGLRLRLTHHLSRPPPHHHALPVEDAAVRLVISRAGQDARASAGPLSAVDWRPGPTGLAGPRLGVGGLWSPGPGPGPPWCGLPWSLRLAATHPGAPTLWLGGPAFGLSSALSGWRPRFVPAVVLLGVPCPGGLRMFGARVFPCLLHALRDGAVFPTHTIKRLHEEPYEHKARSHTQVYTQAFTLV